MSESKRPQVGTIGWRDLTVDNAESVRDFYQGVVGWETSAVDMGGYSDFNLIPPGTDEAVAGVCHARGSNADLPPQWLLYFTVENLDRSATKCREMGGTIIVDSRPLAGGRFCVIRDPAGAVCALYQPPA